MQGRAFLDLAREIIQGATELHYRGSAGRAYYALLIECRDALSRWGFTLPPRETLHTFVRQRFLRPAHAQLRAIGTDLERAGKLRSQADYELARSGSFASAGLTQRALQYVQDALDQLDAIDNDPVRRRQAVAAVRAAFP